LNSTSSAVIDRRYSFGFFGFWLVMGGKVTGEETVLHNA
jgi:hypothetical protein